MIQNMSPENKQPNFYSNFRILEEKPATAAKKADKEVNKNSA